MSRSLASGIILLLAIFGCSNSLQAEDAVPWFDVRIRFKDPALVGKYKSESKKCGTSAECYAKIITEEARSAGRFIGSALRELPASYWKPLYAQCPKDGNQLAVVDCLLERAFESARTPGDLPKDDPNAMSILDEVCGSRDVDCKKAAYGPLRGRFVEAANNLRQAHDQLVKVAVASGQCAHSSNHPKACEPQKARQEIASGISKGAKESLKVDLAKFIRKDMRGNRRAEDSNPANAEGTSTGRHDLHQSANRDLTHPCMSRFDFAKQKGGLSGIANLDLQAVCQRTEGSPIQGFASDLTRLLSDINGDEYFEVLRMEALSKLMHSYYELEGGYPGEPNDCSRFAKGLQKIRSLPIPEDLRLRTSLKSEREYQEALNRAARMLPEDTKEIAYFEEEPMCNYRNCSAGGKLEALSRSEREIKPAMVLV